MFTIARASVDDIMCLAHLWLISDTPQDIELGAGRRISNRLISTTEHRVVQLRRADDFVAGHESHRLVRRELAATTKLLRDAACAQRQARRLLTTVGELAQLAAWIAADNNEHEATYGYVHSGVLAARAACDAPLAGNILSTFSYQIANPGTPTMPPSWPEPLTPARSVARPQRRKHYCWNGSHGRTQGPLTYVTANAHSTR
jgi:hypothetical protein